LYVGTYLERKFSYIYINGMFQNVEKRMFWRRWDRMEKSQNWIYYGLRKVMYMDIRWKKTKNDFIERAKTNTNFVFDTV